MKMYGVLEQRLSIIDNDEVAAKAFKWTLGKLGPKYETEFKLHLIILGSEGQIMPGSKDPKLFKDSYYLGTCGA